MGCSSCATSMNGHFGLGAWVPATARSYITTPGRVEAAPNATAGMHASNFSRAGMGDIFGTNQTNWISGVANEYVVAGALLIVLLGVMK